MAYKFNFSEFAKATEEAILYEAERAKHQEESAWLTKLHKAVDWLAYHSMWTNRTDNLVSSAVGILFYNGLILGLETEGYHFVQSKTGRSLTGRRSWRYKMVAENPVYSYRKMRGERTVPWRYAESHNLGLKTGREYAHALVAEARKSVRNTKGYCIVIAYGMPYASFSQGNMINRTTRMIESAIRFFGKGKMHTLQINTMKSSGNYIY